MSQQPPSKFDRSELPDELQAHFDQLAPVDDRQVLQMAFQMGDVKEEHEPEHLVQKNAKKAGKSAVKSGSKSSAVLQKGGAKLTKKKAPKNKPGQEKPGQSKFGNKKQASKKDRKAIDEKKANRKKYMDAYHARDRKPAAVKKLTKAKSDLKKIEGKKGKKTRRFALKLTVKKWTRKVAEYTEREKSLK